MPAEGGRTRPGVLIFAVILLAVGILTMPLVPRIGSIARAASKSPPPCQSAFPNARSKTIGKTTWYNRQESVRMVICGGFGLEPSADFPMSSSMVCGLLAQVIGKGSDRLGIYADGACSSADLARDPKEPVKYLSAACSWLSDLLGLAIKPAGALAGLACTTAPSAGNYLGDVFESGHELDVAIDVMRHGRCIKYSPTHFGSPWLAEPCADGDRGFSTLPIFRPATPVPGGGGAISGGSGGADTGGPAGAPSGPWTTSVTPLGPTSGPSGFGTAISMPRCAAGLTVRADGATLYHENYDPGYPREADIVRTDQVTQGFLPMGRHQMSFACANFEESVTEWTDPGFMIEVTEPPRQLILANTSLEAGGTLLYESGTTSGPRPCPALPGYEPVSLFLGLERPGTPERPVGYFVAERVLSLPDTVSGNFGEKLVVPSTAEPGEVVAREECNYRAVGPPEVWNVATFTFEPVFLEIS